MLVLVLLVLIHTAYLRDIDVSVVQVAAALCRLPNTESERNDKTQAVGSKIIPWYEYLRPQKQFECYSTISRTLGYSLVVGACS